jgi:ferrous iron transport protein B
VSTGSSRQRASSDSEAPLEHAAVAIADRTTRDEPPLVAILGNPNAGKSTIFNRLTGLRQKVANYPGVTIERKEGAFEYGGVSVRLLDLPGTYSLAAHSPDEYVAVDVLLGHMPGELRPDLVVQVVDASNVERNLFLFSQIEELDLPIVIALNMTDIAERKGIHLDAARLAARLGVPVVPVQGQKGTGIEDLRRTIVEHVRGASSVTPRGLTRAVLPDELSRSVAAIVLEWGPAATARLERDLHPFEVLRAVVDEQGYALGRLARGLGEGFRSSVLAARERVGRGRSLAAIEAEARYAWIHECVEGSIEHVGPDRTETERIDRVLTHWLAGPAIFAGVMILVFQSIFTWAVPLMDHVEAAVAWIGELTGSALPEGALRSLVVDGVFGGVGSVVVFLPQILILFFFIGLLEDCGYMARAAFIMDRLMSKCGLSGKSFIPMLSGFACAVPGIMAARVIEDRRDRLATILVTPLITCAARLPVYSILIATFVPPIAWAGGWIRLQGIVLFALYVLGIVAAVAMAWVFKRTLLRGATPPFVLELPGYKLPSMRGVALRLVDRAVAFLKRAGTTILALTVVVWGLLYFPRPESIALEYESRRDALRAELSALPSDAEAARTAIGAELEVVDREESGAYSRQSLFGRIGHVVEPVFIPLGWDWKISMATIASFPAREIVVSTLGTIYNLGAEVENDPETLGERLQAETWPEDGRPVFTVPVAFSILVFFALCCQCGATIATIRRETNSWGWAWFTFAYMTVLAYAGAFVTYRIGIALAA